MTELPNRKYEHVYAIIRLDKNVVSASIPDRNLITVTKVVLTKEEAEREVTRLSQLNVAQGSEYYCDVTRIQRLPTPFSNGGTAKSEGAGDEVVG
jgi:hypothetical protein